MDLQVIDDKGQPMTVLAVSDAVFARPYNESLVHQCVTTFLMNERQGTRAQKTRGQVAHSTRKPWKQKGTGRARAGMVSSPLWRSGGRAFPNLPDENFSRKINRKMYRAAMSTIYSRLIADGRLFVLNEDIQTEQPKTRIFHARARALGFDSFLYVVSDLDESVYLSSRNLTDYHVLPLECVDPICLIKSQNVLLSRSVVAKIEEALQC